MCKEGARYLLFRCPHQHISQQRHCSFHPFSASLLVRVVPRLLLTILGRDSIELCALMQPFVCDLEQADASWRLSTTGVRWHTAAETAAYSLAGLRFDKVHA